ncbi:hypothetical protein D3C71_1323450 [compost metagenome]
MGAVEFARRDIVEAVIVIAGQPVGAIRVGPNPVLEGLFDPLQLVTGGFGIDDVQHPPFAIGILEHIEDLRDPAVQGVGEQVAGMAAAGAPFGFAGGAVTQLSGLHRPGTEFRHMVDADIGLHLLLHEGDDIFSRDPWRA